MLAKARIVQRGLLTFHLLLLLELDDILQASLKLFLSYLATGEVVEHFYLACGVI